MRVKTRYRSCALRSIDIMLRRSFESSLATWRLDSVCAFRYVMCDENFKPAINIILFSTCLPFERQHRREILPDRGELSTQILSLGAYMIAHGHLIFID